MNKKQLLRGSIVAMIIVFGIMFIAKDSIWAKVSPRTYLGVSLQNTYKALQEETTEKLNLFKGSQDFDKNAFQQAFEVKIKDIRGNGLEYIEEYIKNATLLVQTTKSNNQKLIKINYTDPTENKVGAELFYDHKNLGIKVNDLTTEYIMINLENLGQKFNESALRTFLNAEEISDDFHVNREDNKFLLADETYKEIDEIINKTLKKMELEYVGKEKINNKNCRSFHLILTEDMLKDLVTELYSTLVSDDNLKEYIIFSASLDGYYSEEEIREELKSSVRELKNALKEIDCKEGLVTKLYVNKKNQLVKSECELELNNDYGKGRFNLSIGLLGEKLISDTLVAEATIKAGDEKIVFSVDYNSNLGKRTNEVTQELTMKLKDINTTLLKGNIETTFNKNAKEDNFSFNSDIDVYQAFSVKVNGQGTITEDKKASTYKNEIEELNVTLTSKSGYYGDMRMTLETHYEVSAVKEEDLTPSKKKDLLNMTEGELYTLFTQIANFDLESMLFARSTVATVAPEAVPTETRPEEPTAAQPNITFVYAEVNPLDTIVGQTGMAFKEKVEELSGGKIKIEIQASGVLGSENDVIDSMLGGGGTVDMSRISAFALTSYGGEKSKLLSIPYTFVSRKHFWNFATSDLASEFLLEPHEKGSGVRGLFYGEEGFRHFFTVKPVNSIADLKGMKLRVSNDSVMQGLVQGLGASPTVVSFGELYSALQTGVVDGAEQPIANYRSNAFSEVAPNIILDGHTLGANQVIITDAAWDKLTEEQQNILMEAGKYASTFNRTISEEAENKVLEELRASGVNIVEVKDIKPWQEACKDVIASATAANAALYQKIVNMK